MPRTLRFTLVTQVAAVALLLLRTVGFAQDVTEPALKAAFIYNFARFTEWPVDLPASESFMMCVLGDAAVADALQRVVGGHALAGRPIVASRAVAAAPMRPCRLLYLSGVSRTQARQLVADLREEPVLTISDVEGFIDMGGIAQFVFEQGQLRFRIEIESVKRSRLQISSRLLTMAKP